jgi:hypothetical protein
MKKILITFMAVGLISIATWSNAQVTNLYHFERAFTPVTYSNGSPTAYSIIMGADQLTGIVGPTNIIIISNQTFATEYEGFAWGYDSHYAAWTSALAVHPQYFQIHSNVFYDNVGYVKGTREAYNTYGAFVWYLKNTIAFTSSASSIYVDSSGVTSPIASVLVGTIGDFCPQTAVTDVGPNLNTNYLGDGLSTDYIARADVNAYYKLVPFTYLGVNNDDSDGDGIPDYADGYNQYGGTSDKSTNDYFTTWPLLLSKYADVTQANVRITYTESDPASVSGTNYTPAAGDFRLWKKQAYKTRNKASISSGGDYIPSGTYAATTLGFSETNRLLDFFIEPINPGTNRQLLFEVDPDGGGPKDFVCVDKWESTIIRIENLDWLASTNEALHHTDLYQTNALVLRRCDKFKVDIRLSAGYSSAEHKLWFEAFDTFDGSLKTSKVPAVTSDLSPGEWYAKLLTVSNNIDGTKTARVEINIPTNCPIGEYHWRVNLSPKDADNLLISQAKFPDYVIVLFNPWSVADSVYMATDADRQEYLLRTIGRMWVGNRLSMSTKTWRYAQFDEVCLQVLLSELRAVSLGSDDRRSAIRTSRAIAQLVRRADAGILEGKWGPDDGRYSGGTKPWVWSGTDDIFKAFVVGGTVKYSQCWVYAGVLNSLLRSAGIPARPLTTFECYADHDFNRTVDEYYELTGGAWLLVDEEDVWNFHAWCDAWMSRSDRPGHDGWQAVDSTYEIGPAPLSAVKADVGGDYDADFVYSEVSATITERRWISGAWVVHRVRSGEVGLDISTKTIGADTRQDITSSYK